MTESIENIHVFKTNIATEADSHVIRNVLDRHKKIEKWSIDINDTDKVLRIVSCSIHPTEIIELINNNGYQCHELE
jgi:hypothetical protein